MALSAVQANTATATSTSSVTLSISTSAGNLLVLIVRQGASNGSAITVTLADGTNNVWLQVGTYNNLYGPSNSFGIFYCANAAPIKSITATWSGGISTTCAITLAEIAGAVRTPLNVLDGYVISGSTVASTGDVCGPITTTNPNDIILCLVDSSVSQSSWATGIGFSAISGSGSGTQTGIFADIVSSIQTNLSTTATASTSGFNGGALVAFKAASTFDPGLPVPTSAVVSTGGASQGSAAILPLGKPATFNKNVDQAPMVEPAEQSEAILLPLGRPATYSAPVDQDGSIAANPDQDTAILLTFGAPATFNYNVDQYSPVKNQYVKDQSRAILTLTGGPATFNRPADQNIGSELSEQNESLLLVFGPPATFNYPVDSDAQVSAYPDQDDALLLAFGPSATFNYNVDQPSVFIPDQAPAILTQANPYFVAASIFVSDSTLTNINNGNLYNQQLVISISATLPTFTSGTSSISLQNQAILTIFSPSATWKANSDQDATVSSYPDQDAAILLPFGAPETSSYPVDQNNSYEPTGEIAPNQSSAMLLGMPGIPIATYSYAVDQPGSVIQCLQSEAAILPLMPPASRSYRVDQAVDQFQNQAILLPFGAPATFSANVDQSNLYEATGELSPNQAGATLLAFGPSSTFNYNVDQPSVFIPDQAPAILTQANPYFVGASLFLNENKQIFRMESTLPFFTSGTSVVSLQNQAILLNLVPSETFNYPVDQAANIFPAEESALLVVLGAPASFNNPADQSVDQLQNQAILLGRVPIASFNYPTDQQTTVQSQSEAIILPSVGRPATFNRNVDQSVARFQSASQLLLTLSPPASSSYATDQSVEQVQNQAVLLSFGPPASSTYSTDQSIQGITPAAAILLPFVGFTATSTNPVDQAAAQIQNQAILLTLMPPAPIMSIFLNQNKEAISVTVQEVFSSTISVTEAAENLSITATYGTGALIAVNQNKEAISITATETFSSTVSINEATEAISITASVLASSGIFLTQNKEAISISSALIPVGSSSVPSLQSQALLLPLGAPATAAANVDQNVVAMQNQAVLLPIGKPASSSYSVDQAVIGQQNTAVILTLTAPSTSSTFSNIPSLQNQAMLLPFGKPATATYNTDQSIKGLQTQAMLLPEVAPATSTSNVDQTVTGQQNKAILLTLVSSASSSYNVDQAVPSLQNQAMLLAFGKPASSTYATDQSTQSQQSRASILYGVKPASSSYSADQSVIGQQNQAALLGVSSIIVASLPLVEKKQIIALTAQETFQISNIGITEQKQRLDVEATTAQPVIRSSDRAVVYYPQQSQAILLTYAAPSSAVASAASYPGVQTRAILLPSAQIASSNYATDQMLRQLQTPAILASIHFVHIRLYETASYTSQFKSVYTGIKLLTSTESYTDVETRTKTAYRLIQDNEWAYSTFGKVWSTFRSVTDVEANTSTLSRTQNLFRPLTSTAAYTDAFNANNGAFYSVLLTTTESYTATDTAGKLLKRGISDSENYTSSSPQRTYPVITPTQSGSTASVESYTDSIFVSRFLTRPIFDMMNPTDNEEEANQFVTTVYNPVRGVLADTSRYTDYVTATVTHTIPNFITVKLVTASGYSDSG